MIKTVKGDLMLTEAEAIVNTVNCVGVMGKGIALQMKKAYPDNFKAYANACTKGEVKPGKMFVYRLAEENKNPKFIINFPTKKHWKNPSEIEYLQEGLDDLVKTVQEYGIQSVALPPLGCGNGGLDWNIVRSLIFEKLSKLPKNIEIELYEPAGAPKTERQIIRTRIPNMTLFNATLLKLIQRYLWDELTLSRLEIQKLAYFEKESNDPVFAKLSFEKAPYGPYAMALGNVIHDMDGHFLHNCGDQNDPWRQISLDETAVQKAGEVTMGNLETQACLNSVFELIDGYEDPFGMELLSTVHWIIKNDATITNPLSVHYAMQKWSERKAKLFNIRHIEIAWKSLFEQGWVAKRI